MCMYHLAVSIYDYSLGISCRKRVDSEVSLSVSGMILPMMLFVARLTRQGRYAHLKRHGGARSLPYATMKGRLRRWSFGGGR